MATLKELAQSTGYSPATISRILSGDPSLSVSDEARQRVLEEAGRLNYAATKSRRGRAPKSLLRIGLAERLTPQQQLDDPYFLYLGGLVRRHCLEQRYVCLPIPALGDSYLPPEGEGLDGIVAVGEFSPAQVETLASFSPNTVFLDASPDESRFDSVVLNYELGIRQALELLWELGHENIAFLGPDHRRYSASPAPEARRESYLSLMARHGLGEQTTILDCPMEVEAAARAVRAALEAGKCPTALLCANEDCAVGAVRALKDAGRSTPADCSVVSFNDTPRSALLDPPLTSVSAPVEEMVRTALRLLVQRAAVGGKEPVRPLPQKAVLPPTLVCRESTGPAPKIF